MIVKSHHGPPEEVGADLVGSAVVLPQENRHLIREHLGGVRGEVEHQNRRRRRRSIAFECYRQGPSQRSSSLLSVVSAQRTVGRSKEFENAR